ncbi:MAG: cytochrome B [Alphaproteobacteria bacterium]|nr:cytochrome B [Alphaproteobacteria bacterium]
MTATQVVGSQTETRWVKVWDPFVRSAHWSVVLAFAIAYVFDEPIALHVLAGYGVGVVVVARIVWGFIGPRHARFSDFVTWPLQSLSYLVALFGKRAERHLGHSPAGGWMVLALLSGLLAVTYTGMQLYAVSDGAGPFASFVAKAPQVARPAGQTPRTPPAGVERRFTEGERAGNRFSPVVRAARGLHELTVNLTLILVLLHIAAVLLASWVHRENLVKAMLDGRKHAD